MDCWVLMKCKFSSKLLYSADLALDFFLLLFFLGGGWGGADFFFSVVVQSVFVFNELLRTFEDLSHFQVPTAHALLWRKDTVRDWLGINHQRQVTSKWRRVLLAPEAAADGAGRGRPSSLTSASSTRNSGGFPLLPHRQSAGLLSDDPAAGPQSSLQLHKSPETCRKTNFIYRL